MRTKLHGYIIIGTIVGSDKLSTGSNFKPAGVVIADLSNGARYTVSVFDTKRLTSVKFINATVDSNGSINVTGCKLYRLSQFSSVKQAYLSKSCVVIAKTWVKEKNDYNFVLASPTGNIKTVGTEELLNYKNKYGVANVKILKSKSKVKNASGYVVSALEGQIPLLSDLDITDKPSSSSSPCSKPNPKPQHSITASGASKPMYFKGKAHRGSQFEDSVISCFLSGGTSYTKLLNILVNDHKRFRSLYSVSDIGSVRDPARKQELGAYDNSSLYNRFLFLPFIVGDIVSNKQMLSLIMCKSDIHNFYCFKHIQNLIPSANKKLQNMRKRYNREKAHYDRYAVHIPEHIESKKERGEFVTSDEYRVYMDYKKGVFDEVTKRLVKRFRKITMDMHLAEERYDCYNNLNKMIVLPYFKEYIQRGKFDFIIRNAKTTKLYAELVSSKDDLIEYADALTLYLFAKFYSEGKYDSRLSKIRYNATNTFGDYILLSLNNCRGIPAKVDDAIRKLVHNKKKGVL